MKKFIMVLIAALSLAACSDGDKTTVINNSDRVSDLERRMKLNEDLDAVQSQLIALNSAEIEALKARSDASEAAIADLQSDLATEVAAREAGDESANDRIDTVNGLLAIQAVIDVVLQAQILAINLKFPVINSKLTSLQNQINNLDNRIDVLESEVAQLQTDLSNLTGEVSDLTTLVAQLEATDPVPGPQGPMGPQGPQGIPGLNGSGVSVTTVSLSGSPSCKNIGSGYYAKRNGETVQLYGSFDDCDDNDDRIATIDPTPQSGGYAAYWLTSSKLAFADGSSSANLKILNF